MLYAMVHQIIFIITSSSDLHSNLLISQETSTDHQRCLELDEAEEHLMVGGLSRPDPPKGDPTRSRLMTLPLWRHRQRHSLLKGNEAAEQAIGLDCSPIGDTSRDG